jgi:hypothetical protein
MSSAAMPAATAFLARLYRFPLGWGDDGINLLPFPRADLLDLRPLLLHRER